MLDKQYEHTQDLINRSLADVNTTQLGDIIAYSGGKATVRLHSKITLNGVTQDQADLVEVPVFKLETPGFVVSQPMKDFPIPCMVVFSQYPIDSRADATDQPYDSRRHDLSDAIAIPGAPGGTLGYEDNTENLMIRSKTGGGLIEMSEGGKFRITNGGVDLLQVLRDTLSVLSQTKAKVTGGSSAGMWDINTQSQFSTLKSALEQIML